MAAQSDCPPVAEGAGIALLLKYNSLQRRGNTAWYWVLHRYSNPQPDGLAAIQGYQSANCKTGVYRVRAEQQLDVHNRQIAIFNDGDKGELVQARPGKVDYAVVKFACRFPPQ